MSQSTPPTSDAAMPIDALPKAPRSLTPRARRRAWQEPIVRFLWLSSIAISVAALYFLSTRLFEWRQEQWLIRHGAEVTARLMHAGQKITGRPIRIGDDVEVFFNWHGQEMQVPGALMDTNEQFVEGQKLIIRVDPGDPQHWTNQLQPTPLVTRLIGAYFLGMAAVLAIVLSAIVRLKFLRLWKWGELHEGVVSSHTHTAMAPRSVLLRCQVPYRRLRLIATVTIPQDLPVPEPTATIQLLCNPRNLRQAIPVITYYAR
jgi:hypothetical protein